MGSKLVLKVDIDTKEIKGGRDEFVIRPPGTQSIEMFKHTGKLKIERIYNLDSIMKVRRKRSVVKRRSKEKKRTKRGFNFQIPKIPNTGNSGGFQIPGLISDPKNPGKPAIQLGDLTNLGDMSQLTNNILNSLLAQIPQNVAGLKSVIEKMLEIQTIVENSIDSIVRELSKLPLAKPKDQHFSVVFFRSLDPTSLYLWANKRMTGFNVTWYLQDKNGTKTCIEDDGEKEKYEESNIFFTEWINTVKELLDNGQENDLWKAIKEVRKDFVKQYEDFNAEKYKRMPSVYYKDIDLTEIGKLTKMFFEKMSNTKGDLIGSDGSNGKAMIESLKENLTINFNVDTKPLREAFR